jgi:hypothetical protein
MQDYVLTETIELMVYGSKSDDFLKKISTDTHNSQLTSQPMSIHMKNYFKNINKLFNFSYKEN